MTARALVLSVLAVAAISVKAQPAAVGAFVGSAGPGLEATIPLSERWTIRVSGQHIGLDRFRRFRRGGLGFSAFDRASVGAGTVAADVWLGRHIGVSMGIAVFSGSAESASRASEAVSITGEAIPPGELGAVRLRATWSPRVTPRLSVLVGAPASTRRLTPFAEVGLGFIGSPAVEVIGTGRLAANTAWASPLMADLRQTRWWPILSIGARFQMERGGP